MIKMFCTFKIIRLLLFFFLVTQLICAVSSYAIEGFAVEPYLPEVSKESAVIAFHLEKPDTAVVNLFDKGAVKSFTSGGKGRSHFITISGLDSGTTYTYQVVAGSGSIKTPDNDSSYQIKTACEKGKSFSFAVFGDPRPGDTGTNIHHKAVIDQVVMNEPVFTLVLGDMVDEGEKAEEWEDFFQVESRLLRRSAIFPVLGDNDFKSGKGLASQFFPKLEKGYYRFEWGGIQFFALNAWDSRGAQKRSEFDEGSPQMAWFKKELERPEVKAAPFRVVFIHDPVYISRGRSSDTLRRAWLPVFQHYNIDLVFSSWHLYERSHHKGVTYIISGGAGAEIIWMNKNPDFPSQADAAKYHFCRVKVQSDAMIVQGVATDGTILDEIILTPRAAENDDNKGSGSISRMAKRLSKPVYINRAEQRPEIPLSLFSYDCSYCRRLLQRELPKIAEKYNISFKVSYYNLGIKDTYELFLNAGAEFGRQNADIPAIFVGKKVFGGETEIEAGIVSQVELFLKNKQKFTNESIDPFKQAHDTRSLGEASFETLTFGLVLGAGLLDGLNPCAFTTIIFLISYLSLFGFSTRKIIYTGVMFTSGVFITYFLIGLLFYNYLKLALTDPVISTVINSLLLVVVSILALYSLSDLIKSMRGKTGELSLRLPDQRSACLSGKNSTED